MLCLVVVFVFVLASNLRGRIALGPGGVLPLGLDRFVPGLGILLAGTLARQPKQDVGENLSGIAASKGQGLKTGVAKAASSVLGALLLTNCILKAVVGSYFSLGC